MNESKRSYIQKTKDGGIPVKLAKAASKSTLCKVVKGLLEGGLVFSLDSIFSQEIRDLNCHSEKFYVEVEEWAIKCPDQFSL